MNDVTCVVIGGGYAGIHAVKAIRKAFSGKSITRLRLILIEKNPYHFRKVLLFKLAAKDEDITIPLKYLFPEGIDIIQATVTKIESKEQKLVYQDSAGIKHTLNYNILILAVGSVVRQPTAELGGMPLLDSDTAVKIRRTWYANLKRSVMETDPVERQRLMTIAVVGAGISGIETSAELACIVRENAKKVGLDPNNVRICLLNAHSRLFQEGPPKVGNKLERLLSSSGVTVLHSHKVLQEKDGKISFFNGKEMSVGLCIWTLGLLPNPMLWKIGLPLTPEGYVIVDASYRVKGTLGVYSIGDCAHIMDATTGRPDGKTCKEASVQAMRLGKIVVSDLKGGKSHSHKGYMDFFCFGLGPGRGMVWTRLWGLNILITGKLGWYIRKLTWDYASLLNRKKTR